MTVGGLVGGANILDVILGRNNTALYVGVVDGESITRQEFEYERHKISFRTLDLSKSWKEIDAKLRSFVE